MEYLELIRDVVSMAPDAYSVGLDEFIAAEVAHVVMCCTWISAILFGAWMFNRKFPVDPYDANSWGPRAVFSILPVVILIALTAEVTTSVGRIVSPNLSFVRYLLG